jgi:acyl-phosphate glycerol 3-phosphate acyltransferase
MPLAVALLLLLAAYLVGAVPFGYLIGRMKGVDLFAAGSGNIGATNAARVLGRTYGALVFVLDFLKGAVPVAVVVPLARLIEPAAESALGPPDVLRVGAAALAFLGHLFPVYLGFRGGKGVATGAGTIFVLVPGPAAVAVLAWVVVLFVSRTVSLASLGAVTILVAARLLTHPAPFSPDALPVTLYLLAGTAMVVLKHRANLARLAAGTENRIGDFPMRQPVLRALHVFALGLWFGGAAFFNFVTAPLIFESFRQVVDDGPSTRTANETIFTPSGDENQDAERRKNLASALAGSAVGPVFPPYFGMQVVCGFVALFTAQAWRNAEGRRTVHRWRFFIVMAALLVVLCSWPISNLVSELRVKRFDPHEGTALAAKAQFGAWHLVSLLLSFVTVVLSGVALALAGWLPREER